jgi:UDP-glucose 6-dehydrogenase
VFSPEFLTEKHSIQDFKTTNRILLGGSQDDTDVVYRFFAAVWPGRIAEGFDEPGKVTIVNCEPDVAEMAKLFTNGYLATKVLFANEMYQLCSKMGIDYDAVRQAACLDKRIGNTHLNVPGHDGHFSYGGHCLPKDLNNIRHLCRMNKTGEKLFSAVNERNLELRPERDWEKMNGRAVIKK